MAFRGLSAQSFDLFTGELWLQSPPLKAEQIVIFISGLFKDLRSENGRHGSR